MSETFIFGIIVAIMALALPLYLSGLPGWGGAPVGRNETLGEPLHVQSMSTR